LDPNHGIPSITEVRNGGRRVQDKNNLRMQMEAEEERISRLTPPHRFLKEQQTQSLQTTI
jgi:hypothetical protein